MSTPGHRSFHPSPWRLLSLGLGVAMLVLAAFDVAIGARLQALGPLFGGSVLIYQAWRAGVTLTDDGIEVRSLSWLGASGRWPWPSIDRVEVAFDRDAENSPPQLVLVTVAGQSVRLGRADRQPALVAALRERLAERA